MDARHNFSPVIGIDVGGTQLRVAIMRGANIIAEIRELTGQDSSPHHIIPRLHFAINQVLSDVKMDRADIQGIGIGFAGPLDSYTGTVFTSPNLKGWDCVPLLQLFQERYAPYQWPVYLTNDANASGLGEFTFGAGRGSKNFVYLTISTGIGGCIILDGQVLTGTSGTAAELGHMTIDCNGELCSCGNRGCLESMASGTAIARRAQHAINHGAYIPRIKNREEKQLQIDAREVVQAAAANNAVAKEIIQRAAEALGIGLVNVIHIFNPDVIVLGGGVTQAGSLLLKPAETLVRQRAMVVPARAARITNAVLGSDVGLIGAGALVYLNNSGICKM